MCYISYARTRRSKGIKYVPEDLLAQWAVKDPVKNFERFLIQEGVLTQEYSDDAITRIKQEIDSSLQITFAEPNPVANTKQECADVYKPFDLITADLPPTTREIRFIDAIKEGLWQAMQEHPQLVLMGQDIAEYGGVFKITEGFVDAFGKNRVRNTPLCESAILGAGFGLSINGAKAMVEMQFADFVSEGMTQIINNFAKSHYRWGHAADVVVRMPTGAAVAAGPFHSQSNEAWFFKTPGLKIAYPAFPDDAKGLLITAFKDPNPVMFFEHKALYRSITGLVPESSYAIPFGKAKRITSGSQVSIITYGLGVHWAIEELTAHPCDADLIDLRTLAPLDWEMVFNSVQKTGRVLILHEDTVTGGIGAELASRIAEQCFEYLDAPVARLGSLDTPVPMNKDLEDQFLAKSRLHQTLHDLISY